MSTRTWDYGGASGDWQTAANWSDDTVPVADDTVIFDGTSVQNVTEGMLDSESGATAQCTFDLLHIKSTYTGDIGSNGATGEPCCCAPDTLIIEGSGTYYFLCGKDDQSTDADVDLTIINNPDATVYLYSNANDGANTCQFTKVVLIAGTLYMAYYSVDTDDQGVYVPDLYVAPRHGMASNATVIIEKDAYKVNGTVAGNIEMWNGTLSTDSMVGTLVLYDGTLYYGSEPNLGTAVTEADMNITTLRQYGGTFNWYPDDSGDPYIANVEMYGGLFDAHQNGATYSPDRAKVLGNGAGNDVRIYEGATMKLNNNRANISIAASSQVWNFGGTLEVDDSAQVSWSYDQP